jgi:hypothetical protein
MSRYAMTGIAVLLGLSLAAACNRSTDLPATVESVQERLPALAEAGTAWRPDAYLARVSVRLTDDGYASHLIWASFNSPTEEFESIAAKVLPDGTISVEPFVQTVPVVQVDPITEDLWQLDSQEALAIALDDEGLRFLEGPSGTECSSLVLERQGFEPNLPVVWRLILSDCEEPLIGQTTVIDAMTGEVISRESNLPTAVP